MTKDELTKLQEISQQEPWLIRKHLQEFLYTVEVGKPLTRTLAQNNSLYLWFTQIANLCRDSGIDGKMLMSKTISVEMNMEIIKGMWKALQQALFKKQSTTQLKKTGEIDVLQDHFIRFFAEKFNLELPPFPSQEISKLNNMKMASQLEYPDDYKEPKI